MYDIIFCIKLHICRSLLSHIIKRDCILYYYMTIDIHKAIGKLPIIPKKGFVLPNMNYFGAYNPLDKQLIYDKNGNILRYMQNPTGKTDEICAQHDVDYDLSKSLKDKHIADEKMIKAINELPYNQQQYSTFLVKNIIRSKRKLGLGNNFTMEDLSNELNKPTIQKFERQKVIVNHISEIHSTDLDNMTQYSKINKGYKYIFTNIDVFSKIAYAYPIKSKKTQHIKLCFEKIFKNNKPKYTWSDKEPAFFSKEMQLFFKNNNVKIYHTNSHLKAVIVERFNRSLREIMMKEFVKNNNTVWYNILPKLMKIYNNRYHSTIKMKPIEVNRSNEKYIKENKYTYNKTSKNPKFEIGDLVRISLKRRDLFDKASSNIKWSEELFKIHSINKSNVITHKIKDLNDEIIEGIFYEKELQKSKNISQVYIIEKIIRKNKYFVKWRNYSNDFNSWIDKDDIIKYT